MTYIVLSYVYMLLHIFMEGVKVKQAQDTLHLEVCNLNRNLRQAKNLMGLYREKIAQLDDKLKVWSEQVGRLSEDGWRHFVSSGTAQAQRKLMDVQGEAQQLRQSMDQAEDKVARSRLEVAGLLVELEKDRSPPSVVCLGSDFHPLEAVGAAERSRNKRTLSKRRIEDDLELMSRKASSLRAKTEASSVLDKVQQEVDEYRGILKCGACRDRQKEAVITKCYHLFCNDCVQKLLRNRQRRCPCCGLSFGANDVKTIYI